MIGKEKEINMNVQRRNEIKKVMNSIRTSVEMLESILSDEAYAFESMTESLQSSENGIVSEDAQSVLEDAIEALEEAIECLEDI